MGILNVPLGINLTNHQPLIDGPFGTSDNDLPPVPPGSEYMITEGGLFMLTESAADLMITE